jgi:hypothetical protein
MKELEQTFEVDLKGMVTVKTAFSINSNASAEEVLAALAEHSENHGAIYGMKVSDDRLIVSATQSYHKAKESLLS